MSLYLSVLGPPQLFLESKLVNQLPRKAAVIAAYLAVKKEPVDRSVLADLLWEGEEDAVRRNLRQELFRIKNTPWETVIEQNSQQLALGEVSTDLDAFLQAVSKGAWPEAVALWRGGFLAGLEPKGSEGLWDWLIPERERWERLYREAMLGWARGLEATGSYGEALRVYQELLAQDPLQEAEQQASIRLLALKGDRNAALRQYEHYKALLDQQLSLQPSPEMQALYEQLRLGGLPLASARNTPQALVEPPMVGRAEDWAWLEANLGRGLVLLLAEPGVGKTRLALEFARRKGEVLRIPQRESISGIGFGGLLEVLRQALEAGKLPTLEVAWQEELAGLLPELGFAAGESNKGRLFEALSRLIGLMVHQGGVVVWEDLHWLDWASLEFLPYLVRRCGPLGFYLLVTSRPQYPAALGNTLRELRSEGKLLERKLEVLDKTAVVELVRSMSGQASGGERFAERLHQATEGNPFYILETLRYLFDQGLLRADETAWHTPFDDFTSDYRELPLPPSVREALLGRLHNLGEGALAVVQAIALADFPLSPDLAVGLLEHLGAGIGDLEALWGGGYLRQDEAGYSLRHELVRQAVLDKMNDSRRRWLHRQLAEVLRQTGGALPMLAHHLEASGQRFEAYQAHLMAGRSLRKGPLARQALEHYGKAQVLTPPLEQEQERFRVLIESAEVRVMLGQLQIPERKELARMAGQLGLHERFRLSLLDAEAAVASGQVSQGIQAARQAMSLAQTPWQRGHALFRLAWLEYRGGDPDIQLEPLLECIQAFRDIGDQSMEASAMRNLSGYWFRLGDLRRHAETFAGAWKLAEELEDGLMFRRLKADKAYVDWVKGEYQSSLEAAQGLQNEARERGDLWALWDSLEIQLANASVLGLPAELESEVRLAMGEAGQVGAQRDLALLGSGLGNALLIENRLEEGIAELQLALRDLRDMGEKAYLGHTLFLLGFTLMDQGDTGASQQFLQEAVEIWRSRKELRHQARGLAALALLHLRVGDRAKAQETSAEAFALKADWARGIYDLPLVLYARSRALGDKQGRDLLRETQRLLHELAQGLPAQASAQLLGNRYVSWALSKTLKQHS